MFNIFRKSLVDILPQVRGKYQKKRQPQQTYLVWCRRPRRNYVPSC